MKKNDIKRVRLRIIGLLLLLATGCRKDNKPEPNSSRPQCPIITISSESFTYNLTYDNDGRLLSLSDNNRICVFNYNANMIIATTNEHGAFSQKSIITLNDLGLAKEVKTEFDDQGINWIKTVNDYNKDQLIKSVITSSFGDETTYIYQWKNGNPVKGIQLPVADTTYIEYYTDEPYRKGGFLYISQLITGNSTVLPKNLLKSERTSSYVINCSYSFDDEGKINSAIVVQDTIIQHWNYQYQCE